MGLFAWLEDGVDHSRLLVTLGAKNGQVNVFSLSGPGKATLTQTANYTAAAKELNVSLGEFLIRAECLAENS